MTSKNIKADQKRTMQIVVDSYWHKILKRSATEQETSIKSLTEGILADVLSDQIAAEESSSV